MRLALDPELRSIPLAVRALLREGGPSAFYRGLRPALIGIAPYLALELATYDTLPAEVPSFARGFLAALLASTCCYPLDTVRRQIQIQSAAATPMRTVLHNMYKKEGVLGFYRGFVPNAFKNLPNKGAPHVLASMCMICRCSVYETDGVPGLFIAADHGVHIDAACTLLMATLRSGVRLSVFTGAKSMLAESKQSYVLAESEWKNGSQHGGAPPRIRHRTHAAEVPEPRNGAVKHDKADGRDATFERSSEDPGPGGGGKLLAISTPLTRDI
jgi:Mitochondrial carrier protein